MFDTKLPIYGLLLIFSLVVNIVVVLFIYKKTKLTKNDIVCALIYENIGIIFGAKILTYLTNFNEMNGQFDFEKLGFSSYGAVIGLLVSILIFSFQFKRDLVSLLYTFMPSIPLMYGIGKLGCFFAGCCHGFFYEGIGHVTYNYSTVAPSSVGLFPVQLLESIVFIIIYIYMIYLYKKNKLNVLYLGICFILCGISKFLLDYFRMSHVGEWISINQIISLFFIMIGLVMYIKQKKIS
jgi:Prolipoprotein diacylglyceryltransferase